MRSASSPPSERSISAALGARDVAHLEDAVDEEAQAELGRDPPGRDVRRIEQAEQLEILHDVADGGGRDPLADRARERARADRVAGLEIGLDQPAEDLAAALVHLAQGRAGCAHGREPSGRRGPESIPPALDAARWTGREAAVRGGPENAPRRDACAPPAAPPTRSAPSPSRPDVTRHAEGSCLIRMGDTHVLCTASVEETVPPFLRKTGLGWVTAEYGMLPRSTTTRTRREAAAGKQSGRTQEIQRLIGRSLRAGRRPGGARRAADHRRLRRAAGRRRHALRLDHRRLGGAAAGGERADEGGRRSRATR